MDIYEDQRPYTFEILPDIPDIHNIPDIPDIPDNAFTY
jgi:hypothetical protein